MRKIIFFMVNLLVGGLLYKETKRMIKGNGK
jgi:hypothetical protein